MNRLRLLSRPPDAQHHATTRGATPETAGRNAEYWIRKLRLTKHPEGGWFRETYRSPERIPGSGLPARFRGPRSFSTAIYFLLRGREFSAFHRIRSDELWHFYAGSSLTIHVLGRNRSCSRLRLGRDFGKGQRFHVVVKAGCWLAAEVDDRDSFALVGCTVAPGFEFADFEIAEPSELCDLYPRHRALIRRLA